MKKIDRMVKRKEPLGYTKIIFGLISLIIVLLPAALAIPPLPTEFYGNASRFNAPLSSGTLITAYVNNVTVCGTFNTVRPGVYGTLTCGGRDTTDPDIGPAEGEVITFRIGPDLASTLIPGNNTPVPITWATGEFKYVILVTPPIVCGDGFCDRFESCGSCSIDCGQCPAGNQSAGNGSGGGGGGGGGGMQGGQPSQGTTPAPEAPPKEGCKESWACADWGACQPDNLEYRECVDVNECPSVTNRPDASRPCIFERPPISVNISGEQNISHVVPPERQLPQLIATCTEKMPFFSIPSLLFILLTLLVILGANQRLKRRLSEIEKNVKLEEMKKLEMKFHERRRVYTFMIVFIILALVVYLYHIFFFLCRDPYLKNLWLLALFVVLSPLVIHLVAEIMKFREKQGLNRSKILNDTHYLHVKKLLEIANHELMRSEAAISNSTYSLNKSKQFESLLQENVPIKKIYDDMTKLYDIYKKGAEAINLEKDLVQNIEQLAKDEGFRAVASKYPELDSLRSSLILLYKAYQSKQELYNEISKIEQEYEAAMAKKPEPPKGKQDIKAEPKSK